MQQITKNDCRNYNPFHGIHLYFDFFFRDSGALAKELVRHIGRLGRFHDPCGCFCPERFMPVDG